MKTHAGLLSSASRSWLIAAMAILTVPLVAQSSVCAWGLQAFDTRAFDMPCMQVAACTYNSAFLRSDGRIFVQGESGFLQHGIVPPPPPGMRYVGVGFTPYGHIGLLSNGSFAQWGPGPLYSPPPLPAGMRYTKLSSNGLIIERSDGAIMFWGPNTYGQATMPTIPPGTTVVDFESSWQGTSAILLSNGGLIVWGNNANGQANVPTLPSGVTYSDVTFGWTHTLALRSDGQIEAFGGNGYAPLLTVPPLPPGTAYLMCTAGQSHSVALRSDNVLVAWGSNSEGQLNVPILPPGITCLQLASGQLHSVALLSDGSVRTWGYSVQYPARVPALPGPIGSRVRHSDMTFGVENTVVLYSDGSAEAFGQVTGNLATLLPPLPNGVSYVRAEAGYGHTLALRSDGQLVGYGDNSFGQLMVPTLPSGMTWTDVSVAYGLSFAIRSDGQAFAFGGVNPSGAIPAPPAGVRYVDVDSTNGKVILLRSDGAVLLIGNPTTGIQQPPTPPAGVTYVSVATDDGDNVAIRSDGEAVMWGALSQSPQYSPVPPLPAGVSYVQVEGGQRAFVLRRSDGCVVTCGDLLWGYGYRAAVPDLDPGTSFVQVSASGDTMAARIGPTRTYVSFAPGCAGSLPATRLIPRDTPHIGSTHRVTLLDLPTNIAMLAMGFQRLPPLGLASVGMPGCDWHVSLDAVAVLVGANGQAGWAINIPNQRSLVGIHFYNQALVLDPNASNAFGAVVSDAAEGVVGYR